MNFEFPYITKKHQSGIIGLVVFAAILMPLIIPAALKLADLFKSKK